MSDSTFQPAPDAVPPAAPVADPAAGNGDPGYAAAAPVADLNTPADTAAVNAAPARSSASIGDLVTYEDFDEVTGRTTVQHALVTGTGETTVSRDGNDEVVPSLTVVFIGTGTTLPADVFEQL